MQDAQHISDPKLPGWNHVPEVPIEGVAFFHLVPESDADAGLGIRPVVPDCRELDPDRLGIGLLAMVSALP